MDRPRTGARVGARVSLRVGRYVVVGRFARVAPRAAGPPPAWGLIVSEGQLGYGSVNAEGQVDHWRPLNAMQ